MAEALRWLAIDYRRLGVVDLKWAVIAFALAAIISAGWRHRHLAGLERENRLLRLLIDAEAANDELHRLGSPRRINTSDFER